MGRRVNRYITSLGGRRVRVRDPARTGVGFSEMGKVGWAGDGDAVQRVCGDRPGVGGVLGRRRMGRLVGGLL